MLKKKLLEAGPAGDAARGAGHHRGRHGERQLEPDQARTSHLEMFLNKYSKK